MSQETSVVGWTPDDVANWRSFLLTPTGKKLLPRAAETAPILLEAGDTNAVLIRNGQLIGFQRALQTMQDLAYPADYDDPAPSNYPDLLDDNQWNDGQKLEKK